MQAKTTLRFHFIPVRLATLKQQQQIKTVAGMDVEKGGHLSQLAKVEIGAAL